MKHAFSAGLAVSALALLAVPVTITSAWAQDTRQEANVDFNIPAQDTASALNQLARQAGLQLLFPYDAVSGKTSPALIGRFSRADALQRLIEGTGLEVVSQQGETITLRAPAVTTGGSLYLEEVVVTARRGALEQRKAEVSYALTTVKNDDLQRRGLTTLAEVMSTIPGVWSDPSGGTGSNNTRVRGIPRDGYEALAVYEDGLPIQHDPGINWVNVDQYLRLDLTYDGIEAVRGGPSSIFASNAPGGIINYIVRKGTDVPEGQVRITGSDYGTKRIDLFYGGPLVDDWKIAIGGYFNSDDGVRDPGFTANEGGQGRVVLSRDLENGTLELSAKYMRDNNFFQDNIPLIQTGGNEAKPVPGFDGNYDTLTGPNNRRVLIKTPRGNVPLDIADRSQFEDKQFTVKLTQDLGDAWKATANFRYRDSETDRKNRGSNNLRDATAYLATKRSAALAAFTGATSVAYRYASDPSAVFNPTTANGNGMVIENSYSSIQNPLSEIIGDVSLSRVFEFGDQKHDFTIGLYGTDADWAHSRLEAVGLTEVKHDGKLLDIVALNAAGQIVGRVTDGGILSHGSRYANSTGGYKDWAFYVADEWEVTEELRIDGGFRYEKLYLDGSSETFRDYNLGDATTLADNSVRNGSGIFQSWDPSYSDKAWSLGVNYQFSDEFGVFGRYTNTYRLPQIGQYRDAANPVGVRSQGIDQAEAGVKWQTREAGVFATLFYNSFDDVQFTNTYIDSTTLKLVTENNTGDVKAYGLELEGFWQPLPEFSVAATATWQDPKFKNYTYRTASLVEISFDNNRPGRMPKVMSSLRPTFYLMDGSLRLSGEWQYMGKRFSDDANTIVLPSFSQYNASIQYDLTPQISLTLRGQNLTNEVGLQQGSSGTAIGSDSSIFLARAIAGRNFVGSMTFSF